MSDYLDTLTSEQFALMAANVREQYFADKNELAEVLTMAVILGSFTRVVIGDGQGLEALGADGLRVLAVDVIAYACALRLSDLDIIGPLELGTE